MQQPAAPTLLLPRGLILMASLWLVISWTAAIGFHTPIEASSASYTPGVRLMLISAAIGLMIAWPLLRLSQTPTPFPLKQTVLDIVVLLALVQVVIWPLRLVTSWTAARTAALDMTLVSWAILAGAFVASAVGSSRRGPRNLAILGCVGVCLIGPVFALITMAVPPFKGPVLRLLHVGPLLEVHMLGNGGGTPPEPAQWRWIALVALTGLLAWGGLVVVRSRRPNTTN